MICEVLSETNPVARRPHRCIWCGQAIPKGERHQHIILKYFGDLQNQRWHFECAKKADQMRREDHEHEFDPYENERP